YPGTNYSIKGLAFGTEGFVALCGPDSVLTSKDGEKWTLRKRNIPGWLNNIMYASGRYIAFSDRGAVLTSKDGVTWSSADAGTSTSSAAYGKNTFVFTGAGKILVSTDISNFTAVISSPADILNGLIFGNGRFVAVGGKGDILTS